MSTSFLSIRIVIAGVAVICFFVLALLQPESRYFCMFLVLIGSAGLWKSYARARDEREHRSTLHR